MFDACSMMTSKFSFWWLWYNIYLMLYIFFFHFFFSLNDIIHIIYIFFTAIVQVMSIPFAAYYNYVAVKGMSTAWHVCVYLYCKNGFTTSHIGWLFSTFVGVAF